MVMMSLKKIRQVAQIQKECERSIPVDHKSKFTEEQLEKLGFFVADAIETIFKKVKENPNIKKFEVSKYLGNLKWNHAKLDSYAALCNEEITHAGLECELVARWYQFDQRGNPNAHCAEEDLVTYYIQVAEI